MTDDQVARVGKALAHPARVRIVRLLAQQSECRGHEVFTELPLAQSTVSQHLSMLKDAGVIQARPVGTAMVYCLIPEVLEAFSTVVSGIAVSAGKCLTGQGAC